MSHRLTVLDKHVFTIKDLEKKATAALPTVTNEWLNEGSMDLLTVQDNEDAYSLYKLRPRVMRNVADVDASTTLLGTKAAFPFGFSPAGQHRTVHPDGEIATSRAAAKNKIPMTLSDHSTTALEDVIAQGQGNLYMMHICFYKDRSKTLRVIKRAEAAGYKALVVSADIPVLGIRLNEYRNASASREDLNMPNLTEADGSIIGPDDNLEFDAALTWEEGIKWIRSHTKLPIWLKGITTADDVNLAIEHGVDGLLISNHGGRQLDTVPATLHILREVSPIAKNRIPVVVDGGVRRGSDIFKALALGADFCFAGRIPLWGLAYKGEDGVDLAINILRREFETTMALCGCKTIKEISRAHVSFLKPDGTLARL